jgi:hypothetical protein
MGQEINFDSLRVLEERTQEHGGTLIQLKRARNSLLNVSTLLPPEILGNLFRWNVIPVGDFWGLSTTSFNFLLVCHHWFRVASGTPELWGFWGNSVRIDMSVVEQLRSIWRWHGTPVTIRMTRYAMRSRIVPRGIPYDGFTSTTPRDLSTPSSPPSPSKGRKLN